MKYEFTKGKRSEEPDITEVLFNTQIDITKYRFTQSIWSEEPGTAKVLFTTYIDDLKYQFNYVVQGARLDQFSD